MVEDERLDFLYSVSSHELLQLVRQHQKELSSAGGASPFGKDDNAGGHIAATAGAAVGKGAGMAASGAAAVGGAVSGGKQLYDNVTAAMNKKFKNDGGKEGMVSDGGSMAPKEPK